MRMLLAAAVLVLAMLAVALPAAAQEQGGQAFCGWYWDYAFVSSGGWEYWCWDPQKGWWYGEREDGKAHRITLQN
jgi:hypothetical protein